MSTNCKHWKELDDEGGFSYEFCRAKEAKVHCCGSITACSYPLYFNIPTHRIAEQKRRDAIDRGVAINELRVSNG